MSHVRFDRATWVSDKALGAIAWCRLFLSISWRVKPQRKIWTMQSARWRDVVEAFFLRHRRHHVRVPQREPWTLMGLATMATMVRRSVATRWTNTWMQKSCWSLLVLELATNKWIGKHGATTKIKTSLSHSCPFFVFSFLYFPFFANNASQQADKGNSSFSMVKAALNLTTLTFAVCQDRNASTAWPRKNSTMANYLGVLRNTRFAA